MTLFLPSRYTEKISAGRAHQVWASNNNATIENAKVTTSSSYADKCTKVPTSHRLSNKCAGISTSTVSTASFISASAASSSSSDSAGTSSFSANSVNAGASTSSNCLDNYVNTEACTSSSVYCIGTKASASSSSSDSCVNVGSSSSSSGNFMSATSSSAAGNYKKATSSSKAKENSKAETTNESLDPLKDPNRKFKIVKIVFSKEGKDDNSINNEISPKKVKDKNKNFKIESKSTTEMPMKRGRKAKNIPGESILKYAVKNSSACVQEENNIKTVPNQKGTRSSKRKRESNADESKKEKKTKVPKKLEAPKKDKIPDVSALDFSNNSKSSDGKSWNFKISSWNINGIRAWLEKNGLSYLHNEKPDILCLQETKCSDDKLPDEIKSIDGYHCYWLAGDKDGYSGVGLISKKEPKSVEYGIGVEEHDSEGRVITAEYEEFYLASVYVPNAGRGLVRLEYRKTWDQDFRNYLKRLDEKKPVILCGDLNVAHQEIDLANPKTNKRNAGFTVEEREGFTTLLGEGFVDSFRKLYPDVIGAYTFWTYMMNARAKNVGWRLDYFVISSKFEDKLCDSTIRKDVFGSDHCPITLFLSL